MLKSVTSARTLPQKVLAHPDKMLQLMLVVLQQHMPATVFLNPRL